MIDDLKPREVNYLEHLRLYVVLLEIGIVEIVVGDLLMRDRLPLTLYIHHRLSFAVIVVMGIVREWLLK